MAAEFGYCGTNGEYKTIEHHDFWLVWGESRKKKTKLKDFNSQFRAQKQSGNRYGHFTEVPRQNRVN